jgi:mRNA interferase MazF
MAAHKPRRKTQEIGHPRRGDIYLVNFEPTVGHEIQKTRPALIIQNDIANRFSPITIVAAITSKFTEPPYPTEVIMKSDQSGLSLVLLNQIRSVDRRRLAKHLGRASAATMRAVDRALQISLGMTLQ